ncbi:uncharacterized protein LOC100276137 [Zea mays]|jgi:hypothetical protein|uniref:uncharacterized protein LOC100276137 n=1 Tax=Zea mays TaxID=4577 RepID=UPI000182FC18|nr:uncharacterized protein LOC100276137 [Zea mays]|eukprot:NP_001315486.1 uncharacterized protein LOC100276137 [Zea mays]
MADRALLITSSLSVFQFVPVAHFRSAARKHQRLALADCALHRATQPPTLCLVSVFFSFLLAALLLGRQGELDICTVQLNSNLVLIYSNPLLCV